MKSLFRILTEHCVAYSKNVELSRYVKVIFTGLDVPSVIGDPMVVDGSSLPESVSLVLANDSMALAGEYSLQDRALQAIHVNPKKVRIRNLRVKVQRYRTSKGITYMSTFSRGKWLQVQGKTPADKTFSKAKAPIITCEIYANELLVMLKTDDDRLWVLRSL
jgi:hypothetical protein